MARRGSTRGRTRTASKEKKWMQGARKSIAKRKTKGSFTSWCKSRGLLVSGKVTGKCIQAGLRAKSASIRKKAALAKAFASGRRKKK